MMDPEERYFYTTPQALIAALQEVAERRPDARLALRPGQLRVRSRQFRSAPLSWRLGRT